MKIQDEDYGLEIRNIQRQYFSTLEKKCNYLSKTANHSSIHLLIYSCVLVIHLFILLKLYFALGFGQILGSE